ncbi:MAG: hypothetical protein IBJ11_11290 [Phycisphaerales bacterium]|nr:hypothetical protein [Phycisphaerales bacterium]
MDIISFYTPNGAYKHFAEVLRRSCEKFGITLHVDELPSRGNWHANINQKPQFIRRKLAELKRPVIWCDIDCEVIEYPSLLDDHRHDFMIYNWFGDRENTRFPYQPDKLLGSSGVVFFNYTPPVMQILHQWIEACEKAPPGSRDDVIFDQVFAKRKTKPALKCFWLPRAYNRMDSHWPEVKPVINHVYRDGRLFSAEPPKGDAPPGT